jgi:hypothetical protein
MNQVTDYIITAFEIGKSFSFESILDLSPIAASGGIAIITIAGCAGLAIIRKRKLKAISGDNTTVVLNQILQEPTEDLLTCKQHASFIQNSQLAEESKQFGAASDENTRDSSKTFIHSGIEIEKRDHGLANMKEAHFTLETVNSKSSQLSPIIQDHGTVIIGETFVLIAPSENKRPMLKKAVPDFTSLTSSQIQAISERRKLAIKELETQRTARYQRQQLNNATRTTNQPSVSELIQKWTEIGNKK